MTDLVDSTKSWTHGYDALDRLTSAAKSGQSIGHTYDANGNRLTQSGTQSATYSVSGTSNRVASITGTPARTYTHDAAGNTTGFAGLTFAYSDAGRMASVTSGSGTTSYVLNALGQRVKKSGPAGTRLFVYDEAGHLLREYDGAGALIQETIWMEEIPVATLRPNGSGGVNVFYVHTDHLNTPRRISRPSDNAILWRWDSDPFGTSAANEDPDADSNLFSYHQRFPGQYFDAESGLHYNYFRDYDPVVGRYAESDPIGLRGGINTYLYVMNDPLRRTDPLGLVPGPNTGPNKGCSEDACEQQALDDEQVCKSLPNSTAEQKAVRARCWASVQERFGACRQGKPLPPLVTWREQTPVELPSYVENPAPPSSQTETTATGLFMLLLALAAAAVIS